MGQLVAQLHAHTVARWRQASLTVLEGEGKPGFQLTPPGLGVGTFSWPAPLKGLLFTSLHLLHPRLAITHSAYLHGSRCGGGGNQSFSTLGLTNQSLHDGGLHNRNLHDGSLRTAASATGASATGVSVIGATVAPTLGLLELGIWTSDFICNSQRDSLGATWGHLGKGAPVRCRHSWRWPCRATIP